MPVNSTMLPLLATVIHASSRGPAPWDSAFPPMAISPASRSSTNRRPARRSRNDHEGDASSLKNDRRGHIFSKSQILELFLRFRIPRLEQRIFRRFPCRFGPGCGLAFMPFDLLAIDAVSAPDRLADGRVAKVPAADALLGPNRVAAALRRDLLDGDPVRPRGWGRDLSGHLDRLRRCR